MTTAVVTRVEFTIPYQVSLQCEKKILLKVRLKIILFIEYKTNILYLCVFT